MEASVPRANPKYAIIVLMAKIKEDLTGRKQFRIQIIKKVPRPDHLLLNGSYWLYRCSCGTEKITHRTTVIRGLKSCGCLGKEKKYNTKTEMHYRYLYNVWRALQYRCNLPHNKSYKDYGGRGIKISEEWQDFSNFYNDMIDDYQRGLTLERVDVDGDYIKSNCIWITNEEQAKNRRSSLAYRERTGYNWEYGKV